MRVYGLGLKKEESVIGLGFILHILTVRVYIRNIATGALWPDIYVMTSLITCVS